MFNLESLFENLRPLVTRIIDWYEDDDQFGRVVEVEPGLQITIQALTHYRFGDHDYAIIDLTKCVMANIPEDQIRSADFPRMINRANERGMYYFEPYENKLFAKCFVVIDADNPDRTFQRSIVHAASDQEFANATKFGIVDFGEMISFTYAKRVLPEILQSALGIRPVINIDKQDFIGWKLEFSEHPPHLFISLNHTNKLDVPILQAQIQVPEEFFYYHAVAADPNILRDFNLYDLKDQKDFLNITGNTVEDMDYRIRIVAEANRDVFLKHKGVKIFVVDSHAAFAQVELPIHTLPSLPAIRIHVTGLIDALRENFGGPKFQLGPTEQEVGKRVFASLLKLVKGAIFRY